MATAYSHTLAAWRNEVEALCHGGERVLWCGLPSTVAGLTDGLPERTKGWWWLSLVGVLCLGAVAPVVWVRVCGLLLFVLGGIRFFLGSLPKRYALTNRRFLCARLPLLGLRRLSFGAAMHSFLPSDFTGEVLWEPNAGFPPTLCLPRRGRGCAPLRLVRLEDAQILLPRLQEFLAQGHLNTP